VPDNASSSANLPRIDLHRHLDGNLRLATCLELAQKHGVTLPATEVEVLRPYLQLLEPGPDLRAFLHRVERMVSVLGDADACRRVAYENVEDAARERLDYVELRFSPAFMAMSHRLPLEAVVEAVVDGIEAARRDVPVRVQLIGILSRTLGLDTVAKELQSLLSSKDDIVALDLAGDEASFPGELFVEHFRLGREAGWAITVHAGEASGAESVWQALRELGAQRLGHATRAIEDPALLDYLLEHRIGIESCLTSNVQTSTVPSYESHPLRHFLDRGLVATINTDDPTVSGIDLDYELDVAAPLAGLSKEQVIQAQRNAVEIAFLTKQEKEELIDARNADPGSDAVGSRRHRGGALSG
jgi:adenosine deaminase